ncbi:MAG: class I SAM-dependent methyltransferase [Cyanobacteria bacterium P01_F01_bin.42]
MLSQQLQELSHRAGELSLAQEFQQSLQSAAQLASQLEPYLHDCTTPESPALESLRHRTNSADWSQLFSSGETVNMLESEMLSGQTQGQFLKMLVKSLGAKRVLEVGMFSGYSALAMAEALPDDGRLIACELDLYAAQFAQSCFDESPAGHKIQVRVGSALDSMNQLAADGEHFDFVYVDANKDGYLDYYNILLDSLLTSNGLICVDNTLMQGQPYLSEDRTEIGEAIAQFNAAVAADSRVEQVLLPIRDGVTLIRRAG